MNYRHAFHAGSAADVLKHVVLARIIEHLKRKPAAFRVLDLHAGAGLYDLRSPEAERTGEWRDGVGRLYRDGSCEADPLPGAAEELIRPWRKAVAAVNDGTQLARYPGSPEIARRLVRDQDRLVFNELHPEAGRALAERFARERRAKVMGMDAWTAAKALLPPPERRGLVLFDPPYEGDDRAKSLKGLPESLRRFATGVFCLWYPIKAEAEANALARRVAAVVKESALRIELAVRRPEASERLNGSGLLVVNPPWKLDEEISLLLPALAGRLADRSAPPTRGWRLEWMAGANMGR